MINAKSQVPMPENEPILSYVSGSAEQCKLVQAIDQVKSTHYDIPLIIDGQKVRAKHTGTCRMPHDHQQILGVYQQADQSHIAQGITAANKAKAGWSNMAWEDRASIFLRAAELIAVKYRAQLNAATMLGQSKTVYQAEIDSACELIDFLRFNVHFMQRIYESQPISGKGIWNRLDHRPLDGFVLAVTPFNFTAIAGNLPTAPALMGNTVIWKPASTSMVSSYMVMQILKEAGLPNGVINMISGPGKDIGDALLTHPELAGLHFTGSTQTFQHMWQIIGQHISDYQSYPRIVGETGGKDFIVAHPSCDADILTTAIIRGAFEYQGQKCSAASRAYIPKRIWQKIKTPLLEQIASIKMGDVCDFTNFMGAVIDQSSFNTISNYIDHAKESPDATILAGGNCDDSRGYFISPTLIQTTDPLYKTMQEEIFGPVITVYIYDDADYDDVLALCDQTSPYALTGAIFANDRQAIVAAMAKLRFSAGNFYINDKPTGAVVGQQPFGGSRASGTNDKAGSELNLLRWVSPRTIKENFCAPTDYLYPYMKG